MDNNSTIQPSSWWLMIGVALFFDAVSALLVLLPPLPNFVEAFGFGIIIFWLYINNIKYSKGVIFGGFGIEQIPFVNALPVTTGIVVWQYIKWKSEQALAKVPGGQLANKAIQKGRNDKKIDGMLEKGKLTPNQPLRPLPIRQPTRPQSETNPKLVKENRIKEWSEATNRLNDQRNNALINRVYEGGVDKFNADGEKSAVEWKRISERNKAS